MCPKLEEQRTEEGLQRLIKVLQGLIKCEIEVSREPLKKCVIDQISIPGALSRKKAEFLYRGFYGDMSPLNPQSRKGRDPIEALAFMAFAAYLSQDTADRGSRHRLASVESVNPLQIKRLSGKETDSWVEKGGSHREMENEVLSFLLSQGQPWSVPFAVMLELDEGLKTIHEFVPGKTLNTLLQDQDVKELADLDIKSFQAKFLFDVLIGSGDAHTDNIMITDTGSTCYSIDNAEGFFEDETAIYTPYLEQLPMDEELHPDLYDCVKNPPMEKLRHHLELKSVKNCKKVVQNSMKRWKWLQSGLQAGLSLREIGLVLNYDPKFVYQSDDFTPVIEYLKGKKEEMLRLLDEGNATAIDKYKVDLEEGGAVYFKDYPGIMKGVTISDSWKKYIVLPQIRKRIARGGANNGN